MSFITSIFDFLRFNKKNWKAIVLCLFAATIFWFFNALNKNYSANINFPVSFDYDKQTYVPVTSLPTTIRMNVSGLGWDLFRKSSGLKVPPLVIPLERPVETRKIVGSTLPALFSTQLEGLQINLVLTDTIYVDIDERARKRFKVKIDSLEQYLHPDFGLRTEVSLTPDSVWLEGPKRIVETLPEEIPLALPQKNIDSNFIGEVEIVFQHDEVFKRNPPVIEVSFDVEKLMEITDRIPLEIANVAAHVRSQINVKEINCTYRLPVSLVKTLQVDSLRATVDLKMLPPGNHKIVPTVLGLPPQAHLVKIDTVSINH